MAAGKYGRYRKTIPFKDYGSGSFRQGAKLNHQFFGLDVDIEFGTFWAAGTINEGQRRALINTTTTRLRCGWVRT